MGSVAQAALRASDSLWWQALGVTSSRTRRAAAGAGGHLIQDPQGCYGTLWPQAPDPSHDAVLPCRAQPRPALPLSTLPLSPAPCPNPKAPGAA